MFIYLRFTERRDSRRPHCVARHHAASTPGKPAAGVASRMMWVILCGGPRVGGPCLRLCPVTVMEGTDGKRSEDGGRKEEEEEGGAQI